MEKALYQMSILSLYYYEINLIASRMSSYRDSLLFINNISEADSAKLNKTD